MKPFKTQAHIHSLDGAMDEISGRTEQIPTGHHRHAARRLL